MKKLVITLSIFALLAVAMPVFAYQLQVNIPGQTVSGEGIVLLRNYIIAIYQFAIGTIGILAIIVIMIAGLMWLMAGGSQDRVKVAKEYIAAALTGLVIALTSFVILYAVNPELTSLEGPDLGKLKPDIQSDEPINNTIETGITREQCKQRCGDGNEIWHFNTKTQTGTCSCKSQEAPRGCFDNINLCEPGIESCCPAAAPDQNIGQCVPNPPGC
ncbi:MAG: hypothetical protein COT81_03710 [Candidatus Buchananbacteria bacterium CG10_big_fil_rev_8_21_14_0_10_42_9]|uniref:Uncharacterized protein n=1 Tax=Candidatus Buchananbacteria bacterium CG10_big_fil_rev_8_21_14_0_10_42_9 TaxID=1974526 RepID=A0A2H0W0R6_9BACT|nr:MAG: hypothetical protein COT81_03710 [Candidatus Buchananbacteria bacterium CG10_big_fil_rev_8_21_14_0_10_42_9]